jgi:phosphoribosylaminoimidazolecarboxamide formyltransferase/IMP cyclohydrolase
VSRIVRALLSVSNKAGLLDMGRALAKAGVELVASGGTAKALAQAGIAVREVSEFTGAPEILDGRVKTLHPRIHGGLLGRSSTRHREEMQRGGILPIDLVVVNLYPFRETVARGAPFEDIIENIDIGGPAMIRSAAKNHERVTVLVDPEDYGVVLTEIENHGEVPAQLRFELACKAFAHTAAYDGAIASYLTRLDSPADPPGAFPESLHLSASLQRTLRYGENPHQKAAFYALEDAGIGMSLPRAEVLQGKELSYNNLLDLDAAMRLCAEFDAPAAAIIKHTNPCGCAISASGPLEAYRNARETDPLSAFGGIVALNRPVDAALAREIRETFLECVIAPAFDPEAVSLLSAKKNLRLLAYDFPAAAAEERAAGARNEVRSVSGGFLVQARDLYTAAAADARVVTARAPSEIELANLDFAWRVAKHVKSNAIVICAEGRTLGVGAGQMSRVDSVRIAVSKARVPLAGSVLGSDAFFPFRDSVDEAAKAGVTAIIQPGGSVRDEEAIEAANAHEIAMVFTGQRHFRH